MPMTIWAFYAKWIVILEKCIVYEFIIKRPPVLNNVIRHGAQYVEALQCALCGCTTKIVYGAICCLMYEKLAQT